MSTETAIQIGAQPTSGALMRTLQNVVGTSNVLSEVVAVQDGQGNIINPAVSGAIVQVSGEVVAVSGQFTTYGQYHPVNIVANSGGFYVPNMGNADTDLRVDIHLGDSSGLNVVTQLGIQVSGAVIVSGTVATSVSGDIVQVSGQMVQVASGVFVTANQQSGAVVTVLPASLSGVV